MTTTETTPDSYSVALIQAQDFDGHEHVRLTDAQGRRTYRFTPETIGYVMAALDGRRVAVCMDARSGHVTMDVELRGTRPTPGYGGWQLLVRYFHGAGCTTGRPLPDGRFQQACPQSCRGYHDTYHSMFTMAPWILPMAECFASTDPEHHQKEPKWEALKLARECRYAESAARVAQDQTSESVVVNL